MGRSKGPVSGLAMFLPNCDMESRIISNSRSFDFDASLGRLCCRISQSQNDGFQKLPIVEQVRTFVACDINLKKITRNIFAVFVQNFIDHPRFVCSANHVTRTCVKKLFSRTLL